MLPSTTCLFIQPVCLSTLNIEQYSHKKRNNRLSFMAAAQHNTKEILSWFRFYSCWKTQFKSVNFHRKTTKKSKPRDAPHTFGTCSYRTMTVLWSLPASYLLSGLFCPHSAIGSGTVFHQSFHLNWHEDRGREGVYLQSKSKYFTRNSFNFVSNSTQSYCLEECQLFTSAIQFNIFHFAARGGLGTFSC